MRGTPLTRLTQAVSIAAFAAMSVAALLGLHAVYGKVLMLAAFVLAGVVSVFSEAVVAGVGDAIEEKVPGLLQSVTVRGPHLLWTERERRVSGCMRDPALTGLAPDIARARLMLWIGPVTWWVVVGVGAVAIAVSR